MHTRHNKTAPGPLGWCWNHGSTLGRLPCPSSPEAPGVFAFITGTREKIGGFLTAVGGRVLISPHDMRTCGHVLTSCSRPLPWRRHWPLCFWLQPQDQSNSNVSSHEKQRSRPPPSTRGVAHARRLAGLVSLGAPERLLSRRPNSAPFAPGTHCSCSFFYLKPRPFPLRSPTSAKQSLLSF